MQQFIKDYFEGNENNPSARFLAFDICHSYFKNHRGKASSDTNIFESVLVLWSYLGSWGMFRGSSKLSKANPFVLKDVIAVIDEYENLFDVDIPKYDECGECMKACYQAISEKLRQKDVNPTLTLVTKIMFGVYSCIPAIDGNVKEYFEKENGCCPRSIETLMARIKRVYEKNQKELNPHSISTVDWNGDSYRREFNSARLFDMFAYVEGKKSNT